MRYLIALSILLGTFLPCFQTQAIDTSEIGELLRSGELEKGFLVLGILTLEYTFQDLLAGNVSLHDVAVSMNATLLAIEDDTNLLALFTKQIKPKSIKKMKDALEKLMAEPESMQVTWASATRGSFSIAYPDAARAVKKLAQAGIVLPLAYLEKKYPAPGSKVDWKYFLITQYLDKTDWSGQYGFMRYYELLTLPMCELPCDPSKPPSAALLAQIESVQTGIQLGILRTKDHLTTKSSMKIFGGNDCCNYSTRTCVDQPDLGCSMKNGFCTFGSYFCP